jgi:hypothetical protein
MIIVMRQKMFLIIFTSFISLLFLSSSVSAQKKAETKEQVQINKSDPWTSGEIITPEALNSELKTKTKTPIIVQIGFKILYDQNHIPGAVFAGPAFKPEGIESLKEVLKNVNHKKNIVIYCGCCKWKDCPNIRPAFKTVKDMGFKNAKVLYLQDTFMIDWVNKGYPAAQ